MLYDSKIVIKLEPAFNVALILKFVIAVFACQAEPAPDGEHSQSKKIKDFDCPMPVQYYAILVREENKMASWSVWAFSIE